METRPLAEVRQNLSKIVDAAVTSHERFDITRNGKRAAVLLGAEDYDSLIETLDILADADLVREVHAGLHEAAAGDLSSHDEVVAEGCGRRESCGLTLELPHRQHPDSATRPDRAAAEAVAAACVEFIGSRPRRESAPGGETAQGSA